MKSIIKIYMICCLITLIVGGCNKAKSGDSIANESTSNSINITNDDIYNCQWTLISRARFVQGTIVSLENLPNGTCVLNLKVEVNFHDTADPVDNEDFLFKVGEAASFILKSTPSIGISNGRRIVIYEGQVSANNKDNFIGAEIRYYEDDNKFYDLNKREITLPPKDYPNSNALGFDNILDTICS